MGMPAFLNDRGMIDSLLDQGVPLREARNWAVVGCVSACPVNMQITTKRLAQCCIIAKCFEFALNDGVCMMSREALSRRTGSADEFSFEDLMEAFRLQVEFAGAPDRHRGRAYVDLALCGVASPPMGPGVVLCLGHGHPGGDFPAFEFVGP